MNKVKGWIGSERCASVLVCMWIACARFQANKRLGSEWHRPARDEKRLKPAGQLVERFREQENIAPGGRRIMSRPRKILCLWALSIFFVGNSDSLKAQQDLPPEVLAYAHMVLYNGKVLTVDDRLTIAQAVAVRDGKILAVGTTDRILKVAGPNTVRMDLQGGTLIPGFTLVHGGVFSLGQHGPSGPEYLPNYSRIRFEVLDDGLRKIKEAVEKVGPGEWVFVKGDRTAAAYQLTRQILDTIAPNNPLLFTLDNTTGFVNSKALAYIPHDVQAGIYKDESGEPTGKITGWAYGTLTYEILPWPSREAYEEMVREQKEILKQLVAAGVTTFGTSASGLAFSIVRDLYVQGDLPMRGRLISEMARENPYTERDLKRVGNFEGIGDEWLKVTGMTLSSLDSNPDNAGFLTRKPKQYMFPWDAHGPHGENKFAEMAEEGKDWKEYSDYKNAILSAQYGWSVYDFHAQGDGALELILEVFDKINEDRPIKGSGRRVGVVHGSMRPPDLAKRLAAYEGLSSHNAGLFMGGDSTFLEKIYGADEVAGMQPIRDLIDLGLKPVLEIRVGGGRPDTGGRGFPQNMVLAGMEGFITRKNPRTGKLWGPQQKITREEAVKMATAWAARYYGDEKVLGTIEPGKLADFIVLGGDYMTVPEENISELPILKVIVGGKIAYEKK